ncbi:MAG: YhdH/YhfP family quinone oxidoreductase [Planctomycetota bacterium]
MSGKPYRALVVREASAGTFTRKIETLNTNDLPEGDLLIRVLYSSLNYKDALSATGNKGVTRNYPHTPGIDAAGVIEAADCDGTAFSPGQQVIVTGHDLGMNTPGGYGEYIRVPASWAIVLPPGLTLRDSMICGTAGFTAAACALRLQEYGLSPEDGDILVTGATGGVGSLAVAILTVAGYRVVAATGKPDAVGLLKNLGAKLVIAREDVLPPDSRPLAKGRWAGVVETVGGDFLDAAIRTTKQHGAVTCCGMIAGDRFSTSVFPFILRGVALFGVDSAEYPMDRRMKLWANLAGKWKVPNLERLASECDLGSLSRKIDAMLAGKSVGRVIVRLQEPPTSAGG